MSGTDGFFQLPLPFHRLFPYILAEELLTTCRDIPPFFDWLIPFTP